MEHQRIVGLPPDADVLIHAGDVCRYGGSDELKTFAKYVETLPYKQVLVIAGNHDTPFTRDREKALRRLSHSPKITYLQDNGIEIDGKLFWGSPWTVGKYPDQFWAFGGTEFELIDKWKMIPAGVDVLITHSPPRNMLDKAWTRTADPAGVWEPCGSVSLLKEVVDRIKPKVHTFGHIHESYGMHQYNGTKFVNASVCDWSYIPNNPAMVIDL